LTGTGGISADFVWDEFNALPLSPGQPNPGQTFTGSSPTPSQAFSFDKVTVSIVQPNVDRDGDGILDSDEILLGTNPNLPDSDNNGVDDGDEDFDDDGQSNFAELNITQTDALDANSLFTICLEPHPTSPGILLLTFPTLTGRTYEIFTSSDLNFTEAPSIIVGTDSDHELTIIPEARPLFYRVEARLNL